MAEPPPLDRWDAQACFSAFLADLQPPSAPSDVRVAERTQLCLATIAAHRGQTEELQAQIWSQFGTDLPRGSRVSITGDVGLVGLGPDRWLGIREQAPPDSTEQLALALTGIASVVPQAGAYGVLRISGASARLLLSRGAHLDFHPAIFGPGSAAVAAIAHISVILWQPARQEIFDVAVPRSYASSFWHWLESAATGMGVGLAAG